MSVDEHTIELAGSPVFYRRRAPSAASAGEPLYLHGVPTSSDDWVPFLERTGGIAPDLIGFGRSAKGGHLEYTLEGHAAFIEALLDALSIDRVRLVMHDWGAGGGLAFAQRNSQRVARLVLINALPLLEGFRWPRIARLWRRPGIGELVMGFTTKAAFARTLRKGGDWGEAELKSVWRQFDQGTQRAILRLHRSADEQRLAAAGAGLEHLDAPALVLWGARDPWISAKFGEAYTARLPHARFDRIEGAGHWPWLDDPSVVERVTGFLEAT